jgi:acetolactate synthase-1/2/3 large subunit
MIKLRLNGSQILIEELIRHGVEVVFGYPGGSVLNIYDELYKSADRIKHVLTAHEQGAAHAADGYARVKGRPGVVIATSGPGATNLVTGIANAYLDSVPLVAITGNVAENLLGRDSFQEVDIVGITQPIVKHNYIVRDVRDLERTISEAFLLASTGRRGPVLIDIPKSVQAAECDYAGSANPKIPEKKKAENDLEAALEMIRRSKRPYIYCGGGVVAAGAEAETLELSKRICAPVGLSMMGLTAIPNSYELNLGMCGMHGKYSSSALQAEADLLIALGVRFSDRATGDVNAYTQNCGVVHIDIDDAEIGKNVSARVGLCGDVGEILRTLLENLPACENAAWLERVREFKKEDLNGKSGLFTPENIIGMVNKYQDEDTVVATDVGQHQMWTMLYYKFERPRTLLTSGGLGTMGYGLGASIGGSLARDKKRTVLFTSDGSFGMNLNELATAVSQELPLLIIVLNNGVLGMVRQWQEMFYDERYSQTTLGRKTDFPALARAFGADGHSAKNLGELEEILKSGLRTDRPCLIDCAIDMDEKVFPMIPPGGTINDIVVR